MHCAWIVLSVGASLVIGCRDRAETTAQASDQRTPTRGDVVVVERATAEFFQGRVLSVTGATLKVQTTDEGEPVTVATSDVYRVPPAPHSFAVGDPGICRDGETRWMACRVTRSGPGQGATVEVDLGSGVIRNLEPARVLAPNPVTALNLQRYFEAVESRSRFEATARAAGDPTRPPGWLPESGEPVLGRRDGEWYSARVQQALEERGVRVVWEGDEHPDALAADAVVPAPPAQRLVARGEFALNRPKSPSSPWERVRVDATGPEEAVVVGIDGQRRRIGIRRLLPLSPRTPPQ
jgi:hypothetical protein